MKHATLLGSLTLLMVGCNAIQNVSSTQISKQAVGTAIVDPRIRYQTFQGWGTSLAWFANVIGGWSDTSRNQVMDALYGDAGLRFNIARYNLGADAPDNVCRNQMRPGGNVQSLATSLGVYDWSRDANQRWVLRAAINRGANLLEAFVNSAPSFMLTNHCTAGATSPTYNNLRTDMYDDFGRYVADVLKHFRDVDGITFTTVAPLNEPDSGYWSSTGKQEGMNVSRAEQPKIIGEVANALQAQGVTTPVSAMDTTDIDLTRTEFLSYPDAVKNQISQINTHAYKGSQRSLLRNTAQKYNKPLWMSEYGCCDTSNTSANQLSTALKLANTIRMDLNDMQVRAWVYWQAVENSDGSTSTNHTWGLLKANFLSGQGFSYTKGYYAMGQFSRFIRPGAQILPVSNVGSVAALNSNGQLVIVSINDTTAAKSLTLNLSGFSSVGSTAQLYRTSATENLVQLASATVSNKSVNLSLPAQSITTVVIGSVVAPAANTSITSGASYKVLNKNSWKALDVYGAATTDGAIVGQYEDNEGNNQRWIFTDLGNGYYRITNKNSGKVLDVVGEKIESGANVIQYTSTGKANQQWKVQATSGGYVKIINRNSLKVLDINGESINNTTSTGEARAIQWDDNGGDNQQWLMVRAD
ncbi:RICIN domain-containing protein [Deinococcus cellulosilyticus]|uniref:Ricin B lectin domain-containing protein n=1 Tax=Deinococcus cellulosilyticus (strain DSM 18568 / NBRC 106333 / KACC 11606 / 5516J-15) TaxID=1223518 RepID=A0A511MW71_DEIC1|nr:RICIN domain-containing protein [Deinococcus cellulosilyticus]GEM44508.1 hypothetical protein DC3_01430 [Deinococcus cellulosilyticus NBRC 106333 = KACC 11606]